MKNLLKIMLSALVALFMVTPALAYPDVSPSHWAAKQIEILTEKGVIVGYPDGTFKPDDNVSRAEFASMAIKALGQEHTNVAQPVRFTDIDPTFWAYDAIQKALYFDLISCPPDGQPFRPDDTVTRAESISVAVNALTTEQISEIKAKEVLSKKFADINEIPEWFLIPAGKAEILNMLVTIPSQNKAKVEANRPATRAEVAGILYEMMEQAKLNPNAKLTKYISSQTSDAGEIYSAAAPENYVTKDKYILVYKGSTLKGQLLDVRKGKWFVRNGVLVLDNSLLTTNNDQTVSFNGVGEVTKNRNWFMKIVRATLKGEKLNVEADGVVYMKLLKPVKVDLTNGWIFE